MQAQNESSIIFLLSIVAACSGGKSDQPPRPFTGAPIAVEVKGFHDETIDVRVYNFSDKEIINYNFLYRFLDKNGNPIKLSDREGEVGGMSMQGPRMRVRPHQWQSFAIEIMDDVPAGAAKAEVLVEEVTAVDGDRLADKPLWKLDEPFSLPRKWPTKKKG